MFENLYGIPWEQTARTSLSIPIPFPFWDREPKQYTPGRLVGHNKGLRPPRSRQWPLSLLAGTLETMKPYTGLDSQLYYRQNSLPADCLKGRDLK
jgi:hypothetical protein